MLLTVASIFAAAVGVALWIREWRTPPDDNRSRVTL